MSTDTGPTVSIVGVSLDQRFLLAVESALLTGVQFSHDGHVIGGRERAHPAALTLFAADPFRVALSLEWLAQQGRLHHARP